MKKSKKEKESVVKKFPLCYMLTGTQGIETPDGYRFFLRKFVEWNRGSGKFDVLCDDSVVGAYTGIRMTSKTSVDVEIRFVLHELAAMTFGEYLDRINDELQKAVRRQYIDSFKL